MYRCVKIEPSRLSFRYGGIKFNSSTAITEQSSLCKIYHSEFSTKIRGKFLENSILWFENDKNSRWSLIRNFLVSKISVRN